MEYGNAIRFHAGFAKGVVFFTVMEKKTLLSVRETK